MDFETALGHLDSFCMRIDGKRASTNRSRKAAPRKEALNPAWWYEHTEKSSDYRNPRKTAYLTAYVRIAGEQIPADGIRLDDGFIWPDRAVMHTMDVAGCVRMKDGQFILTDKGRDLIAPYLAADPGTSDSGSAPDAGDLNAGTGHKPRRIWLR